MENIKLQLYKTKTVPAVLYGIKCGLLHKGKNIGCVWDQMATRISNWT
jgi:hypothetical protein